MKASLWQKQEFCDYVKSKPNDLIDNCDENPVWIDNIHPAKFWGLNPNDEDKFLYRWLSILVASVYDSSVTLETDDKTLCRIISKYGPSKKWLKAQEQYIKELSCLNYKGLNNWYGEIKGCDKTPYNILEDYAHYGDVVLNSYLRETMSLDEINEFMREKGVFRNVLPNELPNEDLETRLRYTVNTLNKVIERAPKLEKDIIVYRGVHTMTFEPGDTIPIKGFLSTSVHIGVALLFARKKEIRPATLLVIHVPAGTPCVDNSYASWQPMEAEIIFPPGINIIVESCQADVLVPTIDDDITEKEEMIDEDMWNYGFSCSFDTSLTICHCVISS